MLSLPPTDNSLMKAFINKLLSIYLYICYNGVDESKMGKILVGLDDELEKRFREGVFRRYGMKKGNLTNAISEAIELWLKSR